ncbi:hypothetical protein H8A95_08010 [Bradyrhizobium sp. Pear76]|uniref:hypothetical protein n=1 Tax=Bradyrhizobium oropedii TaxID=1571201 RepID=UPI001E3905CB|nr:hypothetical protein [Bradyrhizobium oropedii]MCC8962264.1 hypothetical protein [Bradyrhizobium oropedii]
MIAGLKTPKEFLTHVVDPDMKSFAGPGLTELRLAYHACNSLLSLSDWVIETHQGKRWTYRGAPRPAIPSGKKDFLKQLCELEPHFAIVADIANATKHLVLNQRRTALEGAPDIQVRLSGGFDPRSHGMGGGALYSLPRLRILVRNGQDYVDVRMAAGRVHELWKELIEENGW